MSGDGDARETLARSLVAQRMAFYGYTPQQIEEAGYHVEHFAAGCYIVGLGEWECADENGKPNHPAHDEYDATAEFICWVLDALPSPAATPTGGDT